MKSLSFINVSFRVTREICIKGLTVTVVAQQFQNQQQIHFCLSPQSGNHSGEHNQEERMEVNIYSFQITHMHGKKKKKGTGLINLIK